MKKCLACGKKVKQAARMYMIGPNKKLSGTAYCCFNCLTTEQDPIVAEFYRDTEIERIEEQLELLAAL